MEQNCALIGFGAFILVFSLIGYRIIVYVKETLKRRSELYNEIFPQLNFQRVSPGSREWKNIGHIMKQIHFATQWIKREPDLKEAFRKEYDDFSVYAVEDYVEIRRSYGSVGSPGRVGTTRSRSSSTFMMIPCRTGADTPLYIRRKQSELIEKIIYKMGGQPARLPGPIPGFEDVMRVDSHISSPDLSFLDRDTQEVILKYQDVYPFEVEKDQEKDPHSIRTDFGVIVTPFGFAVSGPPVWDRKDLDRALGFVQNFYKDLQASPLDLSEQDLENVKSAENDEETFYLPEN